MTELLTSAQMRATEDAAIASGAVTGLALMERAGQGVVAAIFEQWPDLAPSWGPAPKPPEFSGQDEVERRAVVLCGPGNNGGDGFVVARLLKEAGWAVDVFLYGDKDKLPPDARANYERWIGMGSVEAYRSGLTQEKSADLVIDALFGTGLSRPVDDPQLRDAFSAIDNIQDAAGSSWGEDRQGRHTLPRTVAIDLPSGICADSGKVLGGVPEHGLRAARFDLSVTFHAPKLGHYLNDGPMRCGKLVVKDIGLASAKRREGVAGLGAVDIEGLGKSLGHKYTHGHALILSGGVGKGGAARLAARGALRVGAGAVTVACPPVALIENAAQLNAVMLQSYESVDALEDILADRRINACCLGPGLGTGAREAALLAAMLGADEPRPTVLDADALSLLAGESALFAKLHGKCVMTPHGGEFARLFPDLADKLDAPAETGPAYSKVDATRAAARRAGCVVVFKGPDTVIADPSGRCRINASVYERAAPWLATAGSGDVLAGFITGLLARGFDPMGAAETGAWLHTGCALCFGPGLIAEDLPEELPKVFRSLGV